MEGTYEVLDHTVRAEDNALSVAWVVAVNEESTTQNPCADSEQDTHDR